MKAQRKQCTKKRDRAPSNDRRENCFWRFKAPCSQTRYFYKASKASSFLHSCVFESGIVVPKGTTRCSKGGLETQSLRGTSSVVLEPDKGAGNCYFT
jgi:hypothetical protein